MGEEGRMGRDFASVSGKGVSLVGRRLGGGESEKTRGEAGREEVTL